MPAETRRYGLPWPKARALYEEGIFRLYPTYPIEFKTQFDGHSTMISQKAKYAMRALLALASTKGEALVTSEIAERQRIPRKFLEQILLDLKRDGLVQSKRGKMGGYALLKPADMITFGHVLRLIDGPIAPLPCLSRLAYRRCEDCPDEAGCEIRRVFARVANSARDVLDRTTIAEALTDPRRFLDLDADAA